MRMGAIFARGSCTALKWVALFGVVFALGAGSTAAQVVLPGAGVTTTVDPGKLTLQENGSSKTVLVTVDVPAGTPNTVTDPHVVTLTIATDDQAKVQWTNVNGTVNDVTANVDTAGVLSLSFDLDLPATGNTTSAQRLSALARLQARHDDDTAEETVNIALAAGGNTGTLAVTIEDDDVQVYELRGPADKFSEGESVQFTLSATRPFAAGETTVLRVELESENDDSDYDFGTTAGTVEELTLGDAASTELQPVSGLTGTITLVSEPNDRDRLDDTITLTVTYAADKGDKIKRGDLAIEDPLELTVVDQHKLPDVMIASKDGITIVVDKKDTAVETLMEGQVGTVTLVADRGTSTDEVPDHEDIEVALKAMAGSTADSADYDLRGSPVEIEAASGTNGTGSFMLEVEMDQDIGTEMLMLMGTVSGDDMYGDDTMDVELGSITFVDATMPKIEAKSYDEVKAALAAARMEGAGSNGMWNPGETMSLMASDMFMWPETTTSVVLGNVVVDDTSVLSASTSNDMLTLTAMAAGETPVSVTATVVAESSSFEVTQTVSNVATIKFPVMVDAHMITAMSDADVQAAFDAAVAEAAAENPRMAWEPGGAEAAVSLDDLFDVPESISASYLAESSDPDDVTVEVHGDHVALMPMSAGMAEITVTAVDTAEGMAASVMATVMVMAVDPAAITYTLSGPEDMNVAEGMSAMLTVMASDPVPMETEVMVMRDRAASSADDMDYELDPMTIMIPMGGTMGTTMVMAVEDNMMEDMEELVLFAMAGDMMVEGEVKLYLWDAAVPALPIIAQLLLAGILGIGGYRRYLRRR